MLRPLQCLQAPAQGVNWNSTLLNRLCYSIGSISGAMSESVERPFIIEVIRSLLNLCESMRGKGNKAVSLWCVIYAASMFSITYVEGSSKAFRHAVHVAMLRTSIVTGCGSSCVQIVASNIMYVVGQYPRFLKAHWKFLKTVICKLFEFMHETFPGVRDMACETFLKVAQKCKNTIAATHPGEVDAIPRSPPGFVVLQRRLHFILDCVDWLQMMTAVLF